MKIPTLAFSTTFVAAVLAFAPPVSAEHRQGGGGGNHGSNHPQERHETAVPRQGPRPAAPPAAAPRVESAPPRNFSSRSWSGPAPSVNTAVPRSSPGVRGDAYRSYSYRNDGARNYGSHNTYSYHGSYSYRAPVHFYRPYYAFRPRYSIGFGLWIGYPVPYASAYYDPFYYGYAYPSTAYPSTVYPYPAYPPSSYPPSTYPPQDNYPPSSYPQSGYPPSAANPNAIGVQPGQANTGGLSFDITPADAAILVDGNYAGTVGQYTENSQPLGLPAGRHRIEIQAPGFRTITFDADIVAGQVLPYQGTMERR